MGMYESRKVVFVKIPLPSLDFIIRPEQAIVEFARGKSIDFGCLCYLRRSKTRRKQRQGQHVDISSFDPDRAAQVAKMIGCAGGFFESSGRRPASLQTMYYVWLVFMNWCDDNEHVHVLRDIPSARAALHDWLLERRRMVDQHLMNNNTASGYQDSIIKVLQDYYATSELALGMNLLGENQNLKVPTSMPDDRDQELALAWATCLMTQLTRLLIGEPERNNPENYPFLLRVPECATHPSGKVWIFPLHKWCVSEKEASETQERSRNSSYDYCNGLVRTEAELRVIRPDFDSNKVAFAVRRANEVIDRANTDPHHWARMEKGLLAQAAFYVLFLSLTGANDAQASGLPWSEELEQRVHEPSTSRQGFRQIKYRAAGREVSFEIGVEYMSLLRRYMQLRRYLLAGHRCELLFFQYNHGKLGDPIAIDRAHRMLAQFYAGLDKLIPNEFKTIKSKQWRVSRQHQFARRGDPALAALYMQHSVETALRDYSNGSEVEHQEEMGQYFAAMQRTVLKPGVQVEGSEPRSVGICAKPSQPVPIVADPPVAVKCDRSEGCLYCENYRLHADEIDVRKLVSARHCIRVTAQYATSVEEHDQVFSHVLARIEEILTEVKGFDAKLVRCIEKQVDEEGLLDSFWSAKLDTLMALGMELL